MKIVISTAVYYPMINGVAVFSHNLAEGLAAHGHEVIVLTPSQTKKSHLEKQGKVEVYYLKSVDVKVYPDQIHQEPEPRTSGGLKLPKLFYKNGFKVSLFPSREVTKILNQFRPDVIHVQVSDPIGLSVVSYARKNHIPVVTTEHNEPDVLTDPLHLPSFAKKPANYLLSSYFRSRQMKSDYVTMPTRLAIENLFRGKILEIPVEAVSNGVDLTNFKPGLAPSHIYTKYQFPSERPTVLYIGRIDPEKQVGTILESFAKVLAKVPQAILVIVGDGVDLARLKIQAEKLGLFASTKPDNVSTKNRDSSVYFLGRILPPDLYELYKTGSVFATASEIETQGIVLIEAAASGLPLVAVDAGAVAEICRNGENGFLLKPGDVDGIAEALTKILSNQKLQQTFAKKSLELAARHDFEKTLDKFESIYQKVVAH